MNTSVRPYFVGSRFHDLPYLSGIGCLLRVSRLNAYLPSDYRFAFGITVRRSDDLSILLTFSDKRKQQLSQALAVPAGMRRYWDWPQWLPFSSDGAIAAQGYQFRHCPQCLRQGYHTLLHQLPWLNRCPWHGMTLRSTCLRCRKALHLAGVRGPWLGVCSCGYDHVDETLALRGLDACEAAAVACRQYLDWAVVSREQTHLITPQPAVHDLSVLVGAITLPEPLASRSASVQAAQVHRFTTHRSPQRFDTADVIADFVKVDCLHEDRAVVIETPAPLARRVAQIAVRLALLLPADSLSNAEMSQFLKPLGLEAAPDFVPARRPSTMEIGTLPLRSVGQRRYLDLHCVSRVTRQAGHRMLQAIKPTSMTDPRSLDPEAARVALAALTELLARGYAEGIRIVLGRHVPDLYGTPRDRPHLSEPWVVIRRLPRQRLAVQIVWAQLPHPD